MTTNDKDEPTRPAISPERQAAYATIAAACYSTPPAREPVPPRARSPKQREVMAFVRVRGIITLDDAVALIGKNIYTNGRFHVGNVLSDMVKRGLLVRIKPGVFRAP